MKQQKKSCPPAFPVEHVPLTQLRPHPRNYRTHPEDQLAHIVQSLQRHGVYKNLLVAEDYTLLAGHGVYQAAEQLKLETLPVMRLPIAADSPAALKILAGDNEIARLCFPDDRALTELLKELQALDLDGLLGSGFDEQMLAGLLFATRPASEIQDKDVATAWSGLPSYDNGTSRCQLIISFRTLEDRRQFSLLAHIPIKNLHQEKISVWYPPKEIEDANSYQFEIAPPREFSQ